ncbi:amino acid ABC transporter [Escherichia sp. E4208]|nr:amino acid ABC transporter [Escherichia sp. E4742]TGB61542.1 amino acid ABC transporter [Escherichia sp. E5028]TGB64051.1 amino acid ABC transporter [Escherichia sp. E4930]TGB66320.1 amino acid ABC transporter [Escherichia coli]TGB73705.1 amino acid ABC transporter [Escherichia sp. E4702]TGB75088.1 amino acid ABC transporter [Escherichia sp. E4694]TGB81237.1 amino acid ABC transporter [Escherichia sp. E4208]TGB81956.1 amino acid ABC transporter [Escherichia sp. E3659]TGB92700.1 amino aci
MHAATSLRKIPRFSGIHHFYAFCPNIYSSEHVLNTGYRWKRNWD